MAHTGIRYFCNGPRVYQEGEFIGHKGCGADLTAAFAALPADGRDHEIECPRCGTVGVHMKTPASTAKG
jgi:hypothetical protein